MIPTVKREVDDWWIEAYLEMRHQTSLQTRIVLQQYVKQIPAGLPNADFTKALNELVTLEDQSKLDDILILYQVKTWSFGPAVDWLTLDEISESKRLRILSILNEVVIPLPVSGSGN